MARELINRIQNIRDSGFEVTDKIRVEIEQKPVGRRTAKFAGYIASQTLPWRYPAAEPVGEVVVETDGRPAVTYRGDPDINLIIQSKIWVFGK